MRACVKKILNNFFFSFTHFFVDILYDNIMSLMGTYSILTEMCVYPLFSYSLYPSYSYPYNNSYI